MARLDRSSGIASAIVERPISVYSGALNAGPHYNTKTDQIHLGKAHHLPWSDIDIFGVIVHECGHVVFPAPYPAKYRSLSNLLDDCRQERQMAGWKPHLASALRSFAINVIANRAYDEVNDEGNLVQDPWSEEHFNPTLWALLFFRHNMTEEIKEAANAALRAWVVAKGLDQDEAWNEKFLKLVKSGLAITRLATVSERTLEQWCELYCEVFPGEEQGEGSADQQASESNPMAGDNDGEGQGKAEPQENGDKGKNEWGEGNADQDNAKADAAAKDIKGKGKTGDEESEDRVDGAVDGEDKSEEHNADKSREAKPNDELRDALEKLRQELNKESEKAKQQAKDDNPDANGLGDEEEDDDNSDSVPGVERGDIKVDVVNVNKDAIDSQFVTSFVRTLRKMIQIARQQRTSERRSGKLDMGRIIRSKAAGFESMKPFNKVTDLDNMIPVSCVVATDNSGSTQGIIDQLNRFTHNTLFALRKAKCESAGVVWNTNAKTVVGLRDQVSGTKWTKFGSTGGTSLIPCAKEVIKAGAKARGSRKVAFIFTDGAVWEHEVPEVSKLLQDAGFAAALIISLDGSVPRSGIVDTVVARSLSSVAEKFDNWVKNQYAKAAGLKRVK